MRVPSHIKWLDEEIERVEKELDRTIKGSTLFLEKSDRLQSVPGGGPRVSSVPLVALPELGKLNRQQTAALVGVRFNSVVGAFCDRLLALQT